MTLRTLNYGNYGIFLIVGNAGFCPSTVLVVMVVVGRLQLRLDKRVNWFRVEGAVCSLTMREAAAKEEAIQIIVGLDQSVQAAGPVKPQLLRMLGTPTRCEAELARTIQQLGFRRC